MAERAPADGRHYTAFISYSHKDAAAGRWLHRKLEGYRLPKRLAGTEGENGLVPDRLGPIFRDRDELPAAGDLSEKVRAALAASGSLIVLCSPHSAASPWVAKEIATFRELHPGRPVLTAIVHGEPGQCFSPALLERGIEPLAADLRKEGDGPRLGLLKLVAGLAGVGLDALVQRDAARRVRRVTYVTAGALAAMLVMALLTAVALNARADAERQRAEAEGLVEFMLTDLRDRLKGVGRLDVLTAVNQRALAHYQGQDLEELAPEELERRARILHAMGEDDEKRGLTDRALAQFQEAARTTAKLLEEDPGNPDRIYAHAQSEYWVGYIDYQRQRYAAAKPAFERYKRLADRLAAIAPGNAQYLKEAGYAEGNLCSIALAEPPNYSGALRACSSALQKMVLAAEKVPPVAVADAQAAVANRRGWLGETYKKLGRHDEALAQFRAQERITEQLLRSDPRNLEHRDTWITVQFTIAGFEAGLGRRSDASARLHNARAVVLSMIAHDPESAVWKRRLERVDADLAKISTDTGELQ
jgi:tetratricopeptide (TPR) repeat protein